MLKKDTAKKPAQKETITAEVSKILTASLSAFKEALGDKKFEKRIRKAAKLFSQGAKPAVPKKAVEKKAPVKKLKKKATKIPVKKVALPKAK